MARRSAYLQHLARVPLFSACSQDELRRVARNTTDIAVAAGQVLVREGQRGYEFFVIVDGRAEVSRLGRPVAQLGPGDFFGELALLDRAPRDATVTALTAMEVVVITKTEFDTVLAEAPRMTTKLLAGMARRLRQLDERV